MALSTPSSSIITTLLTGELERFRESLPHTSSPAYSLLQLGYLHLALLTRRQSPDTTATDLLSLTLTMLSHLTDSRPTPLHHHFSSLIALTLIELVDHDSTREEAERGLGLLLGILIPRTDSCWDATTKELCNRKLQGPAAGGKAFSHAGLQHLADLATATEEGREVLSGEREEGAGAPVWEPGALTRAGYLNVLAGEGIR